MAGAVAMNFIIKDTVHIPTLAVKGDISDPLSVESLDQLESGSKIRYGDRNYRASKAGDLIELAGPLRGSYWAVFVGRDGRASRIGSKDIGDSYILFADGEWQAVNLTHPKNSNIKELKEIIVVSEHSGLDSGFNIISPDENIYSSTPGQLLCVAENSLELIDEVSQNPGKEEARAWLYQKKNIFSVRDLANLPDFSSSIIMGRQGGYLFTNDLGKFEVLENKICYGNNNGGNYIQDVAGVMLNPPAASIMDLYYDALHYIEGGEKVMVLFLDGFGYHQYTYSIENGYAPFLGSMQPAEMASSVYKPTTSSGLAAMITGKPPFENGVYSRKQRKIMTNSIFSKLMDLGKESLVVEGDIKFLDFEIEPVLNTDRNGNGTTDDEIFKYALENMMRGYDFVMVHFHSIDDSGHNYGDLDEKTMESITVVDSYVKKLLDNWGGKTIILSDHGMHSTNSGGDHGTFRHEDLVVPYILLN
ncbi:MAG: alkaline phosphatase family protein [Candidatus Humimicrobiaceae bacterium]